MYGRGPVLLLLSLPHSLSSAHNILTSFGGCRGIYDNEVKLWLKVEFVEFGFYLLYCDEFICTSYVDLSHPMLPELYKKGTLLGTVRFLTSVLIL